MGKRKPKASEVAAIEDLKRKIKSARTKGNFKELADLYNELGHQHRHLGNFEDAVDCHQEEINITKTFNKNDKIGLGVAYRNMGETLAELNETTKALQYIKLYRKTAQEAGSLVEEQRAYITMSNAYLRMSEQDSDEGGNSNLVLDSQSALTMAESSCRSAYKLLEEDTLKDQVDNEKELMKMKCNNCQNLGVILELRGKLSDATLWIQRGISIGTQYQFHEYLGPLNATMSGLLLKSGKPKEALRAARNAVKTAKALRNETLEVESQLSECKALCQMDDVEVQVETAKKLLKRLRQKIKKKEHLHVYLEELDPLLVCVVRVCRTIDQLYIIGEDETMKQMGLNEILGDNYSNPTLANYRTAIHHYKKACKFALKARVQEKKLSRLYFSIAETYCDMKDYSNALKYYSQEMAMHEGNPSEKFRTQTNITVVLEKMKKPEHEIMEAHETAIGLSKQTQSLGKQITAIKNFSEYLKSIGKTQDYKNQLEIANKIQRENNVSEVEEMEPDSQDLLDDCADEIDLDNLSEEEESDDEEDDDGKLGKKQKQANYRRVNEVGETQLHLAAKKGDLKAVRKLIRNGHPVKVRDNAGWTPLHEASNFGHVAVAEELLKQGAFVNDPGAVAGELAEKITPLHDAAGNGHCEVIKILIKYGADVVLRDKNGRYPIDSLLIWRESEEGQQCSENQLVEYREVRQLMLDRMAAKGKPYHKDGNKRRKHQRKRSTSPKTSLMVKTARDRDCPIPVRIITDNYDPDQEGEGKKLYENAMKNIRRREPEKSAKERPRAISPGPRGALIPSDLDVNEDWLLPDGVIKCNNNSTSNPFKTAKPKRKRDSTENADNRSTRRRTNSHDQNDEVLSTNFSVDPGQEEDDELMDIESQVHPRREVPSTSWATMHDPGTPSETNDLFNDDGHILHSLFDDDDMMELDAHDDFLPSQRPKSSTVEFGKTIDVPVFEQSEDEEVENTAPLSRRRGINSSPVKRNNCIEISSDESDDFQSSIENPRNMTRLSNVAAAFKKAGKKDDKGKRRMVQTRLPIQKLPRQGQSRLSGGRGSSGSPPEESRSSFRRTSSSASLQNQAQARPKEVRLLNVRILEKILRVPVEESQLKETIDWLANECSIRYLKQYGVKPILSLQTKDGACLTGSDSISLVLEANEKELKGVVSGFDLPPLIERYRVSCAEAGIEIDPEIISNLNICQSSNILNLFDVNLRGKYTSVLTNALQRQNSLRTLVISGCSLFDCGLNDLCKVLPTLPGLAELDISSNGITKSGFLTLVEVFQSTEQTDGISGFSGAPLGLTTLILSHNQLGSCIGNSLATLITRLPVLTRLEIANCNLTDKLLASNRTELTKALNNSRLEDVDISYNNIKDTGLERLLQNLPARRLRSLNCSSCAVMNDGNDSVAKALCTFLSGNEDCCNLKSLELNGCSLNDHSMSMLLETFDRLVRLENLEFACNDRLTAVSFINILDRTSSSAIPVSKLNMGSIPHLWDTPRATQPMILSSLEKKMISNQKLEFLRLPSTLAGESEKPVLSELEDRIASLMDDYAGTSTFKHEKCGANITYRLED